MRIFFLTFTRLDLFKPTTTIYVAEKLKGTELTESAK